MNISSPSRVLEDIIILERDFKYNLSLLQIRESEIERCMAVNKSLQDSLRSSLLETETLNINCLDLKTRLSKAEGEYKDLIRRYEEKETEMVEAVRHLEENNKRIKELFNFELKSQQEKHTAHIERIVREQNEKLQEHMKRYDEEIGHERRRILQLETLLEKMTAVNIQLQNKIRTLESQIISDNCFYNNETNTLKKNYDTAEKEIDYLKNCLKLKEKEHLDLAVDLRQSEKIMTETSEQLNKVTEASTNMEKENEKLLNEINVFINEINKLKEQLNFFEHENNQLKEQLSLKQEVISSTDCKNPNHDNYEKLLQQNTILQAVIKDMKNKREQKFNEEADMKINKLEKIVGELKKRLMEKCDLANKCCLVED